ncbi:MAG: hypothetical protein RBS80_04725 [Thermoguttaceae bacterium]|jgi:hypothetical protein|nr:hypothetical protein [Thermoguttaceae bacterium]
MNRNTLAKRIGKLRPELERAAAGLLGDRCYVALASTLPSPYSALGRRHLAWTGNCLDVALRRHLRPWRGRGGCIMLGDVALSETVAETAAGRPGANTGRILESLLADVLGHELGHVVRSGWTFHDLPQDAELSIKPAVEAWARAVHPAARETAVPWSYHDGQWIRLAQHAAARIGRLLGLAAMASLELENYGLSAGWRYAAALAGEPDRLVGMKLRELAETSPPEAFARLWRADIRRWYCGLAKPTGEQTEALMQGLHLFGGVNDGLEETSRRTRPAA